MQQYYALLDVVRGLITVWNKAENYVIQSEAK